MSIGYKKLSELIDEEIKGMDLSSNKKEVLADLCKKIYMMESSPDSMSSHKLIEEMGNVIGNTTELFNSRTLET